MKPLLHTALLTLLFIPISHGDEVDQKRFLTIAGADKGHHGHDAHTFSEADLPPAIPPLMQGLWSTTGRKFPSSFTGYPLDLNKDGTKEYFIQTPLGGSGGAQYVLLAEIAGQWQEIMNFQGGFYIIETKTGAWPRIVTYTRGGGGHYAKQYWRHDDGAYHVTAIDRHEPVTSNNGKR